MTIQERYLLNKMKKAQNYSTDGVKIDTFSYSFIETERTPSSKAKSIKLCSFFQDEIPSALESLVASGYIEAKGIRTDENLYSITHKGLHTFQYAIFALLNFLITSVAVPIIISIFTTIFTTWLVLIWFGQI